MDFVVVAKKGIADLDNRALTEALINYGVATVAVLPHPDRAGAGLSARHQSAARASLSLPADMLSLRN